MNADIRNFSGFTTSNSPAAMRALEARLRSEAKAYQKTRPYPTRRRRFEQVATVPGKGIALHIMFQVSPV